MSVDFEKVQVRPDAFQVVLQYKCHYYSSVYYSRNRDSTTAQLVNRTKKNLQFYGAACGWVKVVEHPCIRIRIAIRRVLP